MITKAEYFGKKVIEEYIKGELKICYSNPMLYSEKKYIKKNFEGEYLYGHKLKGKEYVNGILEFEGEYLYDKKWNGKGFDKKGNIVYKLNKGTGNVKEYQAFSGQFGPNTTFEGEYLNGKKHGKGKEFNDGKLIFEGVYLNGKRNGKGREYNSWNGEKWKRKRIF